MVEYMVAITLIISWLVALSLAYMERELHVWNVFFKSVGIPGTVAAVGRALKIEGKAVVSWEPMPWGKSTPPSGPRTGMVE